nr:hypothetical protein [uncultured Pseudoxanthomonas sp.]
MSEFWDKGKALSLSDLCEVYASFCVERGLPVLGIGALKSSVRQRDGTKRALSTGGLRKFQSVRKNTDPRFTSAAPLQYGALAFIDSTPIDMRFVEPGSDRPLKLASTFYIAMDGATGYPLGFSFVFGPSRTEGLAILMRVMVRRNGFLPRMLHLDRGSENTSEWIRAFSEGRISLRYSPTAGSPWNQGAETALRFANAQVSHRMFGSTLPDREKRSVDGRFKSLRTARMQFSDLHAELSRYIDEELPHLPAADGSSAVERKNDVIERFGVGGAACRLDDDFMLSTSVTLRQAHKPTARGSIRIEEGTYTSQELQGLLRRRNKIDEVRLDCENPDILYCKLQGEWVKAFHRRIQDHAAYPLHHGLFDLCFGATSRRLARKVRGALGSERRKRADHVRRMVIEREKAPEDQPPMPSTRSTRKTPKPANNRALYQDEK